MRNALILTLSLLTLSLSAQAQEQLAERSQEIADRLAVLENDLSPRDARAISDVMERIEWVLARYERDGAASQYSCLSNGGSGVFEKFRLTHLTTSQTLGGETSRETCLAVVKNQKNSLICLSNGGSGVFEKFTAYDLKKKISRGNETQLETCFDSLNSSTRQFVCASNGGSGVFEKFFLINRETGVKLGGETSLDNCVASIPRTEGGIHSFENNR